jgi:hypothetical protein
MHAMAGEDVVPAVGSRGPTRPDADHREVRRAAADVGHQHDLLALHPALEVEGRGNRLVLELDGLETGLMRRRFERGLSGGVAPGLVVDEENGAAEHHLRQRDAGSGLRTGFQVRHVATDDIEVLHGAAATDVRRLLDQRAAEHALHRSQQTTLEPVDIGGDCGAAELAGLAVAVVAVGVVEHRRRHGRVLALERHQAKTRRALAHRHRGVGGAEIDGAVHGSVVHSRRHVGGRQRAGSTDETDVDPALKRRDSRSRSCPGTRAWCEAVDSSRLAPGAERTGFPHRRVPGQLRRGTRAEKMSHSLQLGAIRLPSGLRQRRARPNWQPLLDDREGVMNLLRSLYRWAAPRRRRRAPDAGDMGTTIGLETITVVGRGQDHHSLEPRELPTRDRWQQRADGHSSRR